MSHIKNKLFIWFWYPPKITSSVRNTLCRLSTQDVSQKHWRHLHYIIDLTLANMSWHWLALEQGQILVNHFNSLILNRVFTRKSTFFSSEDRKWENSFSAWCLLKGHTYLKKLVTFSSRFVKVCLTFQWTPGTKELMCF